MSFILDIFKCNQNCTNILTLDWTVSQMIDIFSIFLPKLEQNAQ